MNREETSILSAHSRSGAVRVMLLLIALASAVLLSSLAGATSAALAACPNEQFRVGASALLPDCRAYELVTPPYLNGFPEDGTGPGAESLKFSSPPVRPDGNSYIWTVSATGLPGTSSTGGVNVYKATRGSNGWTHSLLTPKAYEAQGVERGSVSRDQEHFTVLVVGNKGGSLAFCSCPISYVRYPDGSFHLLGEGTVPTGEDTDGFENGRIDDPRAAARWISPDGSHQIFQSTVQLTESAPTELSSQVYDRTPQGLHLVSLLPDGVSPAQDATFAGSSVDGRTILFQSQGSLYVRVEDERTVELASSADGEVLPGGVTEDGSRAFFVQAGNIYYYGVAAEEAVPVATPGNAILVSVSPEGSHAYFVSESQLVAGKGAPGALNLYAWDEAGSVQFIATVSFNDLFHPKFPPSGLNFWTPNFEGHRSAAMNANRLENTTRVTPDGRVIVFESYEQLTSYPNEGHLEIYWYDTVAEELACVSCGYAPAAVADSELVHAPNEFGVPRVHQMQEVANLSEDGQRVVFESLDSLLPQDVNGARDVYEWSSGTLSLISTGQSSQPSALFAATPSGSDIFFETGEELVGQGQDDGRFAVYDARIGGGLASQQADQHLSCLGEACQGASAGEAAPATPGSATTRSRGNVKPRCRRFHRRKHAAAAHRRHKKPCRSVRRRAVR